MKKNYERPEVIFESFEMSQSIAAGCEFISNHNRGMCGIDTGVGILFSGVVSCDMTPAGMAGEYRPDGGRWDMICYDVPEDNQNVFSS